MRREYEKPVLRVEQFYVNESIAACSTVVQFGPDDPASSCQDFGFGSSEPEFRSVIIKPFYENGCECKYAAALPSGYFGAS